MDERNHAGFTTLDVCANHGHHELLVIWPLRDMLMTVCVCGQNYLQSKCTGAVMHRPVRGLSVNELQACVRHGHFERVQQALESGAAAAAAID